MESIIITDHFKGLVAMKKLLDIHEAIEIKPYKKTRSNQQNRSLHLYFEMIANELNEQGQEFNYKGVITGNEMTTTYSKEVIKDYLWKPLQKHFCGSDTTTKLNTKQINEIVEIISKYLSKNFGIVIDFPNLETLINDN